MENKKCLQCEEVFFGRVDKKFCSDHCRNQYHNSNNRSHRVIREVNKVLKRNRKILLSCNPEGKTRLHRDKLLEKGFNFHYFTSVYTTNSGNQYYFCYEQGYLPLENDFLVLVQKEVSLPD